MVKGVNARFLKRNGKVSVCKFLNTACIIYEIQISKLNEKIQNIVGKSGLKWYGVIFKKLWSKNIKNNQKT